jgi:hypothetical protein
MCHRNKRVPFHYSVLTTAIDKACRGNRDGVKWTETSAGLMAGMGWTMWGNGDKELKAWEMTIPSYEDHAYLFRVTVRNGTFPGAFTEEEHGLCHTRLSGLIHRCAEQDPSWKQEGGMGGMLGTQTTTVGLATATRTARCDSYPICFRMALMAS